MKRPIFDFFEAAGTSSPRVSWEKAPKAQRDYLECLHNIADGFLFGWDTVKVAIIGTHSSKSATLPIVEFRLPNDATMIVRDDFNSMYVSVESPNVAVPSAFMKNIQCDEALYAGHVQGRGGSFPSSRIYGAYNDNPHQFTFCTSSSEVLAEFVAGFSQLQRWVLSGHIDQKLKALAAPGAPKL